MEIKSYFDDPQVKEILNKINNDIIHLTAYINVREEPPIPQPFVLKWRDLSKLIETIEKTEGSEGLSAGGKLITLCNNTTGIWKGTTNGLMAELRILAPGQHTKAHRHTAAAIQFTVEGTGYSVINGKKYEWEKGDVLVYPALAYHELCNTGDTRALIFNVLDVPILETITQMHHENYSKNFQDIIENGKSKQDKKEEKTKTEIPNSWKKIIQKLKLIEAKSPNLKIATYYDMLENEIPKIEPILIKWKELREIFMDILNTTDQIAPRAGEVIFVYNELTGFAKGLTPNLSVGYQMMRPGAKGNAHTHKASNILFIIEGKGYITINGVQYIYEAGDIVVFPGMHLHEQGNLEPNKPLIFYGVSDLPLINHFHIEETVPYPDKFQKVIKVIE